MRIIYIAAGSAGMYCGACNRDVTLVRALIARGHDVLVTPLYTPLRAEGEGQLPTSRVFYSGISVYLQQISGAFAKLPGPIARWLASPNLLRWVSRFAIDTKAKDLGPMTVSVLAGSDGQQSSELEGLLGFLREEMKPDILVLTSPLLGAIAKPAREALGVPIVCNLQGEDGFVDAMPEPYGTKARALMREHALAMQLFVAPGDWYADVMSPWLAVPREKIVSVETGVNVSDYPSGTRQHAPFTVGYLSVINEAKGLDLLVDAFDLLVKQGGKDARLIIAGKVMETDYWRRVERRIGRLGLAERVEVLGEVEMDGKVDVFRRSSVFVFPGREAATRGMVVLEAMCAGIPVIAPREGACTQMVERTGGGMLVAPRNVDAIADALLHLMTQPDEADAMGRAGAAGVRAFYTGERMAEEVEAAYQSVLNAYRTA